MDEYYKEQQELQAFDNYYYFKKNRFLKRTFQLLLSVSIFSLVLCYSSGFSFFPHSFNVYFSTFLFSFFTRSLEKKYMFLICNVILAFLAKSSVSCSTSSSSASAFVADELSASGLSDMKSSAEEVEKKVHVTTVESFESVALHQVGEKESSFGELEKGRESGVFVEEAEQGRESGAFVQEEAEEKEEDNMSVVTQEDDIGEAEAVAVAVAVNEPSTDELNKKIEEFIRKMKEEIRIEAQQQLIAV